MTNPTKNFYDTDIPWEKRPLSFSQYSAWKQSKKQWFSTYVLNKRKKPTREMVFGSFVGDKIASDTSYLPQIPRLAHFEYTLETFFNNVPLIAHMDNFEPNMLHEFKTGKQAWTQTRVDNHIQLTWYCAMLYLCEKTKPEQVVTRLFWLPTEDFLNVDASGNQFLDIRLISETLQVFETTRTMKDILLLLGDIVKTYTEMKQYILDHK